MKYPIGQAIVMSPAFAIAHLYATHNEHYPADGFSFSYQLAVGVWLFIWAILGLHIYRKVLLYYFEDKVVAIALILLVFATNYLDFASIDQGMTHSTLFTLYSLLLWVSIRFYHVKQTRYLVFAFLLSGFMTLIRPIEIISLLIPLFWGVSSFQDFVTRFKLHLIQSKKILFAGLIFACVVLFQLIYWKYVSVQWVVYSYEDQGFSFLNPHFMDYMFSFRAGWITYCPAMLLAFVGIPFFILKKHVNWVVPLFFLLNLYIVSAWDIWWYGGRAMIQSYPILFFCIAALVDFLLRFKWSTFLMYIPLAAGIYFNIWWTYHCHVGKIRMFDKNQSYYWSTLGKWESTEEDLKLLDNRDRYYGKGTKIRRLYTHDKFINPDTTLAFADSLDYFLSDTLHRDPRHITYAWNYPNVRWIRVSAEFIVQEKEWEEWKMMQFIVFFEHHGQKVKSTFLRPQRFLTPNEPRRIHLDVKVPKEPIDSLKITFWNPLSNVSTKVSELRVESIEE